MNITKAISDVKQNAKAKFDETIELHVRLGVDPSKSDQAVRGQVTLPSGTPKQKNIVIATEDLIAKIKKEGKLDADILVATPDLMPKLAQVAKILGPQGLMPNPKTGTVTDDPEAAVKELSGGKISFKADQLGIVHEAIAKASWEDNKIATNITTLVDAIKAAKPAGTKGEFIRSITLCSTMGKGVKVEA